MLPPVQVPGAGTRGRKCRWGGVALLAAACSLAACSGRMDLVDRGTDSTLLTGSVTRAESAVRPDDASDTSVIRQVVAAAELSPGEEPVPWSNDETGSQGIVMDIVETGPGENRCRQFLASRQNFEGVFLYEGETCKVNGGAWAMRRFEQR